MLPWFSLLIIWSFYLCSLVYLSDMALFLLVFFFSPHLMVLRAWLYTQKSLLEGLGNFGMLGIKLGSAAFKANILPVCYPPALTRLIKNITSPEYNCLKGGVIHTCLGHFCVLRIWHAIGNEYLLSEWINEWAVVTCSSPNSLNLCLSISRASGMFLWSFS